MIELCDIFLLDSPAKQQVLFVKLPFNWSSFRAIFGPAIFYGSRSDSLKFSVSLAAWRVAEVFSHSLVSNKNCLLWTSYWISRFSFWQCTTKSNQLTITWHIEMKGKYKTWTPSLDRVHGPGPSKYGPGPWNPYFYKLRLHYKLWFDDLWWHVAWWLQFR